MSDRTDGDHRTDEDVSTTAWVVAAVAAIAVILLLAYARRDPGFDERVPDPPAELTEEADDVD
jgi:hypothetical protein